MIFVFKQKTAYEMRISDWSSDVCSSDLSLLMRIIARKNIVAYFATHPLTRASLTHWLEVAENADWSSTIEVMADFSKAKTVTAERVRFEVAGGDHRMIVAFHFRRGIAFIKFIGTHADRKSNRLNSSH